MEACLGRTGKGDGASWKQGMLSLAHCELGHLCEDAGFHSESAAKSPEWVEQQKNMLSLPSERKSLKSKTRDSNEGTMNARSHPGGFSNDAKRVLVPLLKGKV